MHPFSASYNPENTYSSLEVCHQNGHPLYEISAYRQPSTRMEWIFSFLKVNLKFQFYPQIKTDFPSTSWIIIMYDFYRTWRRPPGADETKLSDAYLEVKAYGWGMFSNRIESNGGFGERSPPRKNGYFGNRKRDFYCWFTDYSKIGMKVTTLI